MTIRKADLLAYTEKAVSILVGRGSFANGDTFRPTQRDALAAYLAHLRDPRLPISERLGYTFELSMALGKTAIYLGIFEEIYKLVKADGKNITGGVVVPLISIFEGIEDEVKKYAPSVMDQTTYYGAGHRETGGVFGVYTYDAFMHLVTSNTIKPDVLFSDEAHRGTSANRAETYISNFLGKIISIGLTATGAFDLEKTIQKSHGKHGFKRTSADSIRLGELAEYAQAQLHVIRVAPQAHEPTFVTEQEKSRYYAALGKKAWTATTRSILEFGKDEHTGDLLSDNISAFYCADIDHIQDTAGALNASAVLKEKARAMGLDGVAVAIHSNMRRSERKAAKRAFDQGRYLAVVSDGVIKEGYNNSRIKNIFDFPRGSIVEKAQIIGRALRKLWNAAKARSEGATIVDTVVYHGYDDVIKDQIAREASILGVVTAWQVLSDTVVYGPGAEQSKRSVQSTPLPPINMDGVTVDSFATIESINTIRAGIDSLVQSRLQLDEKLEDGTTPRSRLISECERTGYGAYAIYSQLAQNCRNTGVSLGDFHYKVIDSWLQQTTLKADAHKFSLVMEEYARTPTSQFVAKIELRAKANNDQTHLDMLIAERDRTGLGALVIFKRLAARCAADSISLGDMNYRMVQSWLDGNSVFVSKIFLKMIMEEYARAATVTPVNRLDFRSPHLDGKSRLELLVAQKDRTGLGSVEISKLLLSNLKKDDPLHQLRVKAIIGSWFRDDKVRTVDQRLYELTVRTYESLPDTDLIGLDDRCSQPHSPRERLLAERDRTRMSGKPIFRLLEERYGVGSPQLLGLTLGIVCGYLANKKLHTISSARLNLLLSAYATFPDRSRRPRGVSKDSTNKQDTPSKTLPKLEPS